MKNKKKYKPAVVKMANYANNFGCKNKSKIVKYFVKFKIIILKILNNIYNN